MIIYNIVTCDLDTASGCKKLLKFYNTICLINLIFI